MSPLPDVKIMETTLRDGSYAINFQFSAHDTEVLCRALEQAGFDLIEIGHGVGLYASEAGHGVADETDEAYLQAAASALRRAKFGMFCIPGIARLEDVDMAAAHGMGFIRIGTNVTEVEHSAPFIARAREHGMMVASNFMKSYVLTPAQLAKQVLLAQSYGSELVYLVDSAGGMLPEEISEHFRAIREVSDIPLAFHGHNNLDMAVANTLHAVELGAAVVDTSLQGIGRSSGNAATEIVVALLQKQGLCRQLDLLAIMDAAEEYVRPLVRRQGLSSLDIVCGQAQFHSSYMGLIRKACGKYGVDPRRLIMKVCEGDKVNATAESVDAAAHQLTQERDGVFTARFDLDRYFGHEQN